MLTSSMLALCLALSPAHAEDDEGYAMNDVGATATLPNGWRALEGGWADWELKAESGDRAVRFHLYMQAFQVDVSEESAAVWAEGVRATYEKKGHTEVVVKESGTTELNGRQWATARIEFKFKSDPKQTGVVFMRSYTSAGQVVHLTALSSQRNTRKAEAAIQQISETLEVKKVPLDTGSSEVSTDAGFAAILPDGWRAPVLPELGAVRQLTEKAGEGELSSDECWVALRPPPSGEKPDVIFACQTEIHIGPLDEHSFEGVEAELYDKFFGRAASGENPPPHGEQVQVGDRGRRLLPPAGAGHEHPTGHRALQRWPDDHVGHGPEPGRRRTGRGDDGCAADRAVHWTRRRQADHRRRQVGHLLREVPPHLAVRARARGTAGGHRAGRLRHLPPLVEQRRRRRLLSSWVRLACAACRTGAARR